MRRAVQFVSRYEVKYPLEADMIPLISRRLRLYADVDPYVPRGRRSYSVRTLYLDTPDLRHYYEKLDGLKVRKKLRVRTYDGESSGAFLEIKRRFSDIVVKERARYSAREIAALIEDFKDPNGAGPDPGGEDNGSAPIAAKFLFHLMRLRLQPALLVLYEREAYLHRFAPYQRATIDTDLRYNLSPCLEDLYRGDGAVPPGEPAGLLELKFNDAMPAWMRRLQSEFGLRQDAFSKYCAGIDACRDALMKEKAPCPSPLWKPC